MASPLEEDILENDFRMITTLGFGSCGKVNLAFYLPTKTQVAIKVLEKNQNDLTAINSEVEILHSLEHRNIVRFFNTIDTLKMTYVVMEYVEGQNLLMFIRDFDYLKEEEASPIFQQVVTAVHFLHQRRIVHRDIKLENIFMDKAGNVKLCDFGMAIQLKEGQVLKESSGSLNYMAPEILARKRYDELSVDMWSLVVLLYALVRGYFPYKETTYDGMYRLITNTKYPIPYHLSKPCNILIEQLLTVLRKHRITIFQLLGNRWLGEIKDHVETISEEILPNIIETMCNIGYNCEEIALSQRHRQPNKITSTFNILKHKFSKWVSHQQNEKPWLNCSTKRALRRYLPLKRAVSEPDFKTFKIWEG